jgi:hypothetical protein
MMDKKTSFKNKQFMMTNDEMNSLDEKTHQVEKQVKLFFFCLISSNKEHKIRCIIYPIALTIFLNN